MLLESSAPGATETNLPLSVLEKEVTATVAQAAPLLQAELAACWRTSIADFPVTLSPAQVTQCEQRYLEQVRRRLVQLGATAGNVEAYPTVSCQRLHEYFSGRLLQELRAAFARAALRQSLTKTEKLEILAGMLRTRHLDARLKKLFTNGEVKLPGGLPFQGKGFRSMGQEAIYAAALRLRRGPQFQQGGRYLGDYVAPMIRDLGLALAMGQQPYDVMAAQMGKTGKPTNGKDLHIGDFTCGILPPAAPITISSGSACGLGFALRGSGRIVVTCIGEGGTSAGEWHEVINFAAVQKLPIVFLVQNNQTALSTPVWEQCAAFNFAQKAIGYGLRGLTIDGTDPEAVCAAVTEAAACCRRGEGPVLVELVTMRMCGHAHHDDMLYFGREPEQFLEYVPPAKISGGYVDAQKYEFWYHRDPVKLYQQRLLAEGVLDAVQLQQMIAAIAAEIEAAAQQVIAAPWPAASLAGHPVVTDGKWQQHRLPLAGEREPVRMTQSWRPTEAAGVQFDPNGKTFWQAIVEALEEELRRDPEVFLLGEDVGGNYGNAFVILKPLLAEFGDRMINTPLAEAAIIACATGAALAGKRPVAEMQFNDFVASGFNQLVNNAAKIFYRWGQPVPMTVRLPWGGLRNAGPYHSQNTEPWFYRTPGLKIVCPSTPREAKGLLKAAIRDDNPVLFLEHIALYRLAAIKQQLPPADAEELIAIGSAHLKRAGDDLTMITYGAYVHRCLAAAQALAENDGIACQVLDLRSLQPLDREAILACVRHTNRVLIVHEDSKTGGIGQSLAALI
ncbi:MAG: thiamine pyrophosphate-dependent enzyme, partial [candidate division KSB1 bacterium]|nr:thiamine pyrophosphate-dependent enzyme [candidate division KSB1 bacterium]